MNAADLISSFSTGTYTVTRRTSSVTYSAGRAQTPTTTTLSIVASIQPASGRDLQRLDEGRRSIETRVVYTSTTLLVGAQAGVNADTISVDGATWEVQTSEGWPATATSTAYCKAIIQRAA